jgi:D-alanyl-D-alanine carboxypeptidase
MQHRDKETRMKRKLLLAVLVFSFISSCSSDDNSSTHITQTELQSVLATEWQTFSQGKSNFGGGLAMQILSPKGDYFVSTGMGADVRNTWHFRTASVTKTFTASAIMLLHQQGKLNIDDNITDNIPGTTTPYVPATGDFDIPYKNQITIRMLLMHRAGVFDVTNSSLPERVPPPLGGRVYLDYLLELDPNRQFTFDELVGIDAKYQLSCFVPGSDYHYSNTGYSILGKIIERVSDRSYADFVRESLLIPNGLSKTSVPVDAFDNKLPEPYVDGFVWDGTMLTNATASNMSGNIAEGNIITTPRDLAAWGYNLMHGKAGLDSSTVELMKNGLPTSATSATTYGLGILYSPALGYGHNGAHEGYLTLMFYRPEIDVTYVLFTNVWDVSDALNSIAKQLDFMGQTADKVLATMGY